MNHKSTTGCIPDTNLAPEKIAWNTILSFLEWDLFRWRAAFIGGMGMSLAATQVAESFYLILAFTAVVHNHQIWMFAGIVRRPQKLGENMKTRKNYKPRENLKTSRNIHIYIYDQYRILHTVIIYIT